MLKHLKWFAVFFMVLFLSACEDEEQRLENNLNEMKNAIKVLDMHYMHPNQKEFTIKKVWEIDWMYSNGDGDKKYFFKTPIGMLDLDIKGYKEYFLMQFHYNSREMTKSSSYYQEECVSFLSYMNKNSTNRLYGFNLDDPNITLRRGTLKNKQWIKDICELYTKETSGKNLRTLYVAVKYKPEDK